MKTTFLFLSLILLLLGVTQASGLRAPAGYPDKASLFVSDKVTKFEFIAYSLREEAELLKVTNNDAKQVILKLYEDNQQVFFENISQEVQDIRF